jgi:excisionase family DNA binding protein
MPFTKPPQKKERALPPALMRVRKQNEELHLRLYTLTAAAKALGRSRPWLYDQIAAGRIGYVRSASGARLVPESELMDYLRRNVVAGTSVQRAQGAS